jgi:ADP-ribosyl-[dinitrogen reductase] hydrolase
MRCWPVALACWQDWPQLLADSTLQSQVTHFHPECVAGSVFINAMIALLIAGSSPAQALPTALEACAAPTELRAAILAAPHKTRRDLPSSGWVRHTVEVAVWALLTTDSYEEAVVQAANLGNDADTAAAVTGALAGAYYGLAGIPQPWQDALQGEWPLHSGRKLAAGDFIRLGRSLAGV